MNQDWAALANVDFLFLRHGEPFIDASGEKRGLTEKGRMQVEDAARMYHSLQAAEFDNLLVLKSGSKRIEETFSSFTRVLGVRPLAFNLSLLKSRGIVARTVLRHPIYFASVVWAARVRKSLAPSQKSIEGVLAFSGDRRPHMQVLMDFYKRKVLNQIWRRLKKFRSKHGHYPTHLIVIASEVMLQLVCMALYEKVCPVLSQELLGELKETILEHGQFLRLFQGDLSASL